jgi:hypothetical protein
MKKPSLLLFSSFVALAMSWTGCATLTHRKAERELEMVARRWCMTVRASQIIPIYPLNEDVQPGDVFVVETPAQRQASDYDKRGYLELEHLLVRLNPGSYYPEFYANGYDVKTNPTTPRNWQFPLSEKPGWSNAPLTGFPSYSIQVKKGGGFNAAFPISGIPVGLSYVSSAQAKISVQLKKTHTFGLDQESLEKPFRNWLSNSADLTRQFARPADKTAFLRLVTRVFLVSEVNVSITGDEASSSGASGGVPKPFDLPNLQDTNAVANYTNSLGALSKMVEALSGSAPGGSIKLANVSSRSVSLNETFSRPLVIGYIAQDYPILEDGGIGNPISTQGVLEGRITDPLKTSLESLRAEQQLAGKIADLCVAKIRRMTPEQFNKSLDAALSTDILSTLERDRILATTNAKAALKDYSELIRRKSRSGAVQGRCELREFLDAVLKLQP